MGRPRKSDLCARESSSRRTSRLVTRASLPRASKSNKPNYKEDVDVEEEEPKIVIKTSSSSRIRQRRQHLAQNLDHHHDQAYGIETETPACRFRHMEIHEIIAQNTSRTDKPIRTMLSLLIDLGLVHEFEKIQYKDVARQLLIGTGWIVRGGIICCTCKVFFGTLSEFGSHRGDERVTPQQLLVPTKDTTLFNCQREAWEMMKNIPSYRGYNDIKNKKDLSDPSDDSCIVCGDGGNLICCSACPSTYHQSCLKLQGIPPDDWTCVYCRCKYCDNVADEGRMLFSCAHCQKKYHLECFGGDNLSSFDKNEYRSRYCGDACRNVNEKLNKMLGVKMHIENDLSWSLIKRIDNKYICYLDNFHSIIISNLKVVIASKIMEESFEPITDRFTKINTIRSVALNSESNFPRIDFSGFYTAILEYKDEIISVASIRVHGLKLAEIPFIATSEGWRSKGMCHTLLRSIETALCDNGIEHIYIPSTLPMVKKWTTSYGFEILTDEVRKEIINTNCLMFLSSTRLQKNIQKRNDSKILPDLNEDPPQD